MNSNSSFEYRLKIISEAALKAASSVMRFSQNPSIVYEKKGRVNFTTQADLESNTIIINELKNHFPRESILSEETETDIKNLLEEEKLWVIDPIDGTNNFTYQRGYSAISIGYVENGEPVVGVIASIFDNKLYTAIRGKGAFEGSNKLSVTHTTELSKTTIMTDNPYEEDRMRNQFKTLLMLPKLPWILMKGSAVLSQVDIARGAADIYYHTGLKPWDNAAGKLLIKEAGGVYWDLKGNEAPFTTQSLIAGNKYIAKEFLSSING